MDAMQKDIDHLLEHNLQMRRMLELLLEQSRPHHQRQRVSMDFKTLTQFEEFNEELKGNRQKKSNLVSSIISLTHM
jgi:hypothetical protein